MSDLIVVVVFIALVIGGVVLSSNEFARYQCESYGKITGAEVYYNNFDICYVEGRRWDEHIASVTAKDGLKDLK